MVSSNAWLIRSCVKDRGCTGVIPTVGALQTSSIPPGRSEGPRLLAGLRIFTLELIFQTLLGICSVFIVICCLVLFCFFLQILRRDGSSLFFAKGWPPLLKFFIASYKFSIDCFWLKTGETRLHALLPVIKRHRKSLAAVVQWQSSVFKIIRIH